MKLINDILNLVDTIRWTIVWKIEDVRNAITDRFSKDELPLWDDESFNEEVPVRKVAKKSTSKKSKKSKK